MLSLPNSRKLDFICLGRANIDLYTIEPASSLRETSGFIKNVGGSPANIAVALSNLGAKAGMITKVSDDQLGHFVVDYLKSKNIDTSQIRLDSSGKTRTSIAFAEVKPKNCDVLFYRKQASDLQITVDDIEEGYICSAKAILISGTALSASPSREAMFAAMAYARKHNTLVFFDMDYRQSAWDTNEEAAINFSQAAENSDVIIGNKEEYEVMEQLRQPGNDSQTVQRLFKANAKIVIIKNGSKGSTAYTRSGKVIKSGIFPVKVLKPYGAGDAFAGALCYGLLKGKPLKECLRWAAAAGAIVVSKQSCTEAMPGMNELLEFMIKNKQLK